MYFCILLLYFWLMAKKKKWMNEWMNEWMYIGMFLTSSPGRFSLALKVGKSALGSRLVCAAPSGRVFAPFWSENGNTLCPFWSGFGYGFWGATRSVWTHLSFQFQMSKKKREICEFEMFLKNSFVCALI